MNKTPNANTNRSSKTRDTKATSTNTRNTVSRLFGTLEYEPQQLIRLPAGLPGLPATKELLPISQQVIEPFVFFQSVQEEQVCMLAVPVLVINQHLELVVSKEDRDTLGLGPEEDIAFGRTVGAFAFVSVEDGRVPTANLLAPLMVHLKAGLAAQVVQPLEESYLRYPLPVWVSGPGNRQPAAQQSDSGNAPSDGAGGPAGEPQKPFAADGDSAGGESSSSQTERSAKQERPKSSLKAKGGSAC